MVTRRAMLRGTAAGSIAAIASAHGVAASAAAPSPVPIPYPNGSAGSGIGYGELEFGALASFQKLPNGFGMFVKFHRSAAEVFYKERTTDGVDAVDIFVKLFDKAWGPFQKLDPIVEANLQDATAGFYKIQHDLAGIFVKLSGNDTHFLKITSDGSFSEPDGDGCYVGD